jgi:hypothetical protein
MSGTSLSPLKAFQLILWGIGEHCHRMTPSPLNDTINAALIQHPLFMQQEAKLLVAWL